MDLPVRVLLVIFSSSVYTNQVIVSSENANHGPSDDTRKFFGDDGDEDDDRPKDFQTPAACQEQTSTTFEPPSSPERDALMAELNAHYAQDTSQFTPEQMASHQRQAEDLQNKMNALPPPTLPPDQSSYDPPDVCKRAIVAMMKGEMKKIHGMIGSKLLPTLTKVTTVVSKVQSAIAKAKAEGADAKKIGQIEADIKVINASLATLKAFFLAMQDTIGKFISSDDIVAFNLMSKEAFEVGDEEAAAKAADLLVKTFDKLQEHVEDLIKTTQ